MKKLMTPEDVRDIKIRMDELKRKRPLELLIETSTIRDILHTNMRMIGTEQHTLAKLVHAWCSVVETELRILGVPKPGIGGTMGTPIPIDSSSVVIRTIDDSVPRGTNDVTFT